jgi:hypothetical protein
MEALEKKVIGRMIACLILGRFITSLFFLRKNRKKLIKDIGDVTL